MIMDDDKAPERDPVAVEEERKCNVIGDGDEGTERLAVDPNPERANAGTYAGDEALTANTVQPEGDKLAGETVAETGPVLMPMVKFVHTEGANPPDHPAYGDTWFDTTTNNNYRWTELFEGTGAWDQVLPQAQ